LIDNPGFERCNFASLDYLDAPCFDVDVLLRTGAVDVPALEIWPLAAACNAAFAHGTVRLTGFPNRQSFPQMVVLTR
jgi:hypothetical protein